MTEPVPTPTQVKRPWRATVRSVLQFAVGLASLLPLIAAGIYTDADQAPVIVVQVLTVAGIITRIMALPQVEAFLQQYLPPLAATPRILGKAVAGNLPPTVEQPGGMRARPVDPGDHDA